MNHSVQVFISGCLTLKLSGSSKTVLISLFAEELAVADSSEEPAGLSEGEMGIVSKGTCCWPLGVVATSAMLKECEEMMVCIKWSTDVQQ